MDKKQDIEFILNFIENHPDSKLSIIQNGIFYLSKKTTRDRLRDMKNAGLVTINGQLSGDGRIRKVNITPKGVEYLNEKIVSST